MVIWLCMLLSDLGDAEICVVKASVDVSRQGSKRHTMYSWCCALIIAVSVISVVLQCSIMLNPHSTPIYQLFDVFVGHAVGLLETCLLSGSQPRALVCADEPPVKCNSYKSITIPSASHKGWLAAYHVMIGILSQRIELAICP